MALAGGQEIADVDRDNRQHGRDQGKGSESHQGPVRFRAFSDQIEPGTLLTPIREGRSLLLRWCHKTGRCVSNESSLSRNLVLCGDRGVGPLARMEVVERLSGVPAPGSGSAWRACESSGRWRRGSPPETHLAGPRLGIGPLPDPDVVARPIAFDLKTLPGSPSRWMCVFGPGPKNSRGGNGERGGVDGGG